MNIVTSCYFIDDITNQCTIGTFLQGPDWTQTPN